MRSCQSLLFRAPTSAATLGMFRPSLALLQQSFNSSNPSSYGSSSNKNNLCGSNSEKKSWSGDASKGGQQQQPLGEQVAGDASKGGSNSNLWENKSQGRSWPGDAAKRNDSGNWNRDSSYSSSKSNLGEKKQLLIGDSSKSLNKDWKSGSDFKNKNFSSGGGSDWTAKRGSSYSSENKKFGSDTNKSFSGNSSSGSSQKKPFFNHGNGPAPKLKSEESHLWESKFKLPKEFEKGSKGFSANSSKKDSLRSSDKKQQHGFAAKKKGFEAKKIKSSSRAVSSSVKSASSNPRSASLLKASRGSLSANRGKKLSFKGKKSVAVPHRRKVSASK